MLLTKEEFKKFITVFNMVAGEHFRGFSLSKEGVININIVDYLTLLDAHAVGIPMLLNILTQFNSLPIECKTKGREVMLYQCQQRDIDFDKHPVPEKDRNRIGYDVFRVVRTIGDAFQEIEERNWYEQPYGRQNSPFDNMVLEIFVSNLGEWFTPDELLSRFK